MRYEFSEVLNDLIDYFILGDIQLLHRFKEEHALPDDLAHAFTHGDSGDQAVLEGIVLPLAGVENLPYRIIFSLGDDPRPARRRQPPQAPSAGLCASGAESLVDAVYLAHSAALHAQGLGRFARTLPATRSTHHRAGQRLVPRGGARRCRAARRLVRASLRIRAEENPRSRQRTGVDIGYRFALRGCFD